MMKYEIPCSVGLGYFVLSLDRSSDSGTTREEIESKVFVGMLPLVPPFIESKTINNASAFRNLVFVNMKIYYPSVRTRNPRVAGIETD